MPFFPVSRKNALSNRSRLHNLFVAHDRLSGMGMLAVLALTIGAVVWILYW